MLFSCINYLVIENLRCHGSQRINTLCKLVHQYQGWTVHRELGKIGSGAVGISGLINTSLTGEIDLPSHAQSETKLRARTFLGKTLT